ncbi:MAG: hypothetical protein KBF93_17595 [Leptospiraceae bacterium]|nr:hypothetical protein [Leptospiraceae bacterium]
MRQSKIIIDTNSYLRIAYTLHPLLKQEFGEEKYCIYSLPDIEKEFDNKIDLHSKFSWFPESRFKENRKNTIFVDKKQMADIEDRRAFLTKGANMLRLFDVSLTDIRCLAYGWVLDFPVVTEDSDMTELANAFKIKVMKTLELVKLMYTKKHITDEQILELKLYLKGIDEYPKYYHNFFNQFQKGK